MKITHIEERPDGMIEYTVTGADRVKYVYRSGKHASIAKVHTEILKSISKSNERKKVKKDKVDKIKLEFENARD